MIRRFDIDYSSGSIAAKVKSYQFALGFSTLSFLANTNAKVRANSMDIYRVNSALPTNVKIQLINEMLLSLSGVIGEQNIDKLELDAIYDNNPLSRKYNRNVGIGDELTTYTGWSNISSQTGYDIWKYSPSNYAYDLTNNLYFSGEQLENRGQASSEAAVSFEGVFNYDGASYTDKTSSSTVDNTTSFSIFSTTSGYLYVGLTDTFSGADFKFGTRGSNYTLVVEYWNGSSWVVMTSETNTLVDSTSNFQASGLVTWEVPDTWSQTTVNGTSSYWIRFSTTSTPVTTAKIYYTIPANSVIAMLALTSTELLNSQLAWCTYGTSIYVTIPNTGVATSEGVDYITSASTIENLKNFFIYNNSFVGDYVSATYSPDGITNPYGNVTYVDTSYSVTDGDGAILVTADSDITITLPTAYNNKGRQVVVKKIGGLSAVTIDGQSGERIDEALTRTLTMKNSFYHFVADGAQNWYVIATNNMEIGENWRFNLDGDILNLEHYETGSWVVKSYWTE